MKYKHIDIDKNGNIIPDITKVQIPEDMKQRVVNIIVNATIKEDKTA